MQDITIHVRRSIMHAEQGEPRHVKWPAVQILSRYFGFDEAAALGAVLAAVDGKESTLLSNDRFGFRIGLNFEVGEDLPERDIEGYGQ